VPSLIDSLPGIEVAVADVTAMLGQMWKTEDTDEGGLNMAFRASQLNLILHIGALSTAEDAVVQFESAIRFAQRFPCRIIILCPSAKKSESDALKAKLFSQCYVGQYYRKMCCCEALMLAYPESQLNYLGNQVSIWLESDLPIYYWFHRIPAKSVRDNYLPLTKNARRIVYDSSIEDNEFNTFEWPDPKRARCLASARVLPLRQSTGQFLSAYPEDILIDGLYEVTVSYADGFLGEAEKLSRWVSECVKACADRIGYKTPIDFITQPVEIGARASLELEWGYSNKKFFRWTHRETSQTGSIQADFGKGKISYPLQVKMLEPEMALGEALFF